MTTDRAAWVGAVADDLRVAPGTVLLRAIAGWSSDGGALAFKGLTDSGEYWVKPLNNGQSPRVTINEYVVGRLGRLIDAPVCEVVVIEIDEDTACGEFAAGRVLEVGLASGSKDVPNVSPLRSLQCRADDDNRRRQAGVHALYDWCWGEDDQWLYDWSDQYRLHSHDHGHFLPGPGPDWTVADLERVVGDPHELSADADGLDVTAVRQYADRLEALTADKIRGMLRTVPRGWPVEQAEIEALGWFLESRAPEVGGRLRALAVRLEGGAGP